MTCCGEALRVLAGVFVLGGVWAAIRGVRLVRRALRRTDDPASSLWLVRGIRGVVVAVALAALAAGILGAQRWLLVFGAVFLAEELYETGVVVLVLRADRERSADPEGPSHLRGEPVSVP